MSAPKGRAAATVEAAEQVAQVLASLGVETAVIGAMALAFHKYVRQTEDFDLATCTEPSLGLSAACAALEKEGFGTDLRQPDAEDPLGGVLEVTREGIRPIEVVNFLAFSPAGEEDLPRIGRARRGLPLLGARSAPGAFDASSLVSGIAALLNHANFLNPMSSGAASLAAEAIREAVPGGTETGRLRVVSLPHLVALKLYAGGPRNRSDVMELLERNRPLDLARIRDVCARHGLLGPIEEIIGGLGLA